MSVHMHAWWNNVLDMSVYFSKAFGCSCNRLNIHPFKAFSGFVISYCHWVFSQSMDARNSLSLWNYMKRGNVLKGSLNTRKRGDVCEGKLTQVHNNTRCGACRRVAQRLQAENFGKTRRYGEKHRRHQSCVWITSTCQSMIGKGQYLFSK